MKKIIKSNRVLLDDCLKPAVLTIENGKIVDISENVNQKVTNDYNNSIIVPGLVDVHVHLREPGFSYKETIHTGTMSAAAGGFTTVFSMPNLNPCPDSAEHLKTQIDLINQNAVVKVVPYGTITKGEMGVELSEMDQMANSVVGFSDDGRGVQSEQLMADAMMKAKQLNKPIVAHCEDNSLLFGGYIHKGEYAEKNNHLGICSESEWKPIERDLKLVEKYNSSYHICHISTKESVELIRRAKQKGLAVTCETAPHYLWFSDDDLIDDGRFKMNPPIRTKADRQALIDGIVDGTIDMIATDHAPHSDEEKSKGLKNSAMGVVGLETSFAACYTKLVKHGIISLEKLIEIMSINPRKRFGIGGKIAVGEQADLAVFDTEYEWKVDPQKFCSKGRATPFKDLNMTGKCVATFSNGKLIEWGKKE